jgi:transposase
MPQATQPSQAHTDSEEIIVGVDTDKDVHVAAVISVLGVLLGTASFPTTAAGYRQLLTWVRSFGTLRRAGVECTGSYGAALSRYLLAAGLEVVEVNQPDKAGRRRRGKTDGIDAEAAARAVLAGRATALAKTSNGPVEMVRMFRLARHRRSSRAPRQSTSSRRCSSALIQCCASPCPD